MGTAARKAEKEKVEDKATMARHDPVMQFGKCPDGILFAQEDGQVTLKGNASGLEEAMQSMRLSPWY
jgi:hypothetical protein